MEEPETNNCSLSNWSPNREMMPSTWPVTWIVFCLTKFMDISTSSFNR